VDGTGSSGPHPERPSAPKIQLWRICIGFRRKSQDLRDETGETNDARLPRDSRQSNMKKNIRILIAEDHTILREGLRALLAIQPQFEVVAEAGDGLEAIRGVEKHRPDLLLLDLSMPRMSGLAAVADIKKRFAETKVIVLTVHKEEEYVLAALRAGADGYVLKDATRDELLMALWAVVAGKSYLSPGISERIIEGYLDARKETAVQTGWDLLSQREREVLKLIAEGYKNREIADYLCISLKTVEKHRANVMKKLDLHNAAALTVFALNRGLINP
jgi:DNA-binding NarL/FixJ family response regulator